MSAPTQCLEQFRKTQDEDGEGEEPMSGVEVSLVDESFLVVATTSTDSEGDFGDVGLSGVLILLQDETVRVCFEDHCNRLYWLVLV